MRTRLTRLEGINFYEDGSLKRWDGVIGQWRVQDGGLQVLFFHPPAYNNKVDDRCAPTADSKSGLIGIPTKKSTNSAAISGSELPVFHMDSYDMKFPRSFRWMILPGGDYSHLVQRALNKLILESI